MTDGDFFETTEAHTSGATEETTFGTLAKCAGIGLLAGLVGGVWLAVAIVRNAKAHAQTLDPMMRASYECSAGMAAPLLGLLCVPFGVLACLLLGWAFLLRRHARLNAPLP
jgi:ABC-type nitrate/sulfonate/bicarbonate transport system permease component